MRNKKRVRLLAYVTGSVNQEVLPQTECLAAENRILRPMLPSRSRLSDPGLWCKLKPTVRSVKLRLVECLRRELKLRVRQGSADVGQSPDWVTLTPDGKPAYVANAASNSVSFQN
jgi:hypothetical protein